MSADDGHIRVSYQDIHTTIGNAASTIKKDFNPDMMIAIGGGGFFPARVLRTFLKTKDHKNIPIQAIGLSLYEEMGIEGTEEMIGKEVVRTQWLDFSTLGSTPLLGKKILIVDEVDDSRTTLGYAVQELKKDIDQQIASLADEKRQALAPTELAIFVVHNKEKPKAAAIPQDVKYFVGDNVPDAWVDYPWEQQDIEKHDQLVQAYKSSIDAQ